MANYIIVGGDNKEYGPVSDAEVRLWISEGRLSAESRVKAEGDAEFRALAQFPEFAEALKPQHPSGADHPALTVDEILNRDYELDIGGCIGGGWDLLKNNFGLIFGAFIIAILIQLACGGALGLVTAPLNKYILSAPIGIRLACNSIYSVAYILVSGPLMGGLFLVYLKTIRKEPTGIGEIFAGFQQCYGQLVLGLFIMTLVNTACMLPFQYVFQSNVGPLLDQLQQLQQLQNDPAKMQSQMASLAPQFLPAISHCSPILLACLVPVIFFAVCWQFTIPLIIDQRVNFKVALGMSWRMVFKHWWLVFGLLVVAMLVSVLGFLGCCVGILFTTPIGIAAMMYAYETIFGSKRNQPNQGS